MLVRGARWLLVAFLMLSAFGKSQESDSATEWFVRARDLTSLRLPGAAPFHMKVAFHAFPGVEMLKKDEKPHILIGDGVYEETWISGAQWRREVTFGSYHAVEVSSGRVRKMQASSDYEPGRVLMLLEALLYPVPRTLTSPEDQSSWHIEHLTAGALSYVRLSSTSQLSHDRDQEYHTAYEFLPNGLLVESDVFGLGTSWEGEVAFAGKAAPTHITIQTAGRTLLTADVAIEPAGKADPAMFDTTGEQADAGMTLRPLHSFAKAPVSLDVLPAYMGNSPTGLVIGYVIDRRGYPQESEIIGAPDPGVAETIIRPFRRRRYRPAEIDGDPCNYAGLGLFGVRVQ